MIKMTPNWLVNWIWNWEELYVDYKYPKGAAHSGLPWEQWLWHAHGDPWKDALGLATRHTAPVGHEAFHSVGGPSTCLTWVLSPCTWATGLAQRLLLRKDATWQCPPGLCPTFSWTDHPSCIDDHGHLVSLNDQVDLRSLSGVRPVGVVVLQPGIGESKLGLTHFDARTA